jgi:hypothetical protein
MPCGVVAIADLGDESPGYPFISIEVTGFRSEACCPVHRTAFH